MERKCYTAREFAGGNADDGHRHGGYRASLTKAMMVYNWLNSLDISAY